MLTEEEEKVASNEFEALHPAIARIHHSTHVINVALLTFHHGLLQDR
jgi:hypothetical protein